MKSHAERRHAGRSRIGNAETSQQKLCNPGCEATMINQETVVPRQLPALALSAWRPTRDTLHQYALIAGKVRSHFMPKSKHWWHITLSIYTHGLTTTPFPVGAQNYELILDLAAHRLVLSGSDGRLSSMPLAGQSTARICRWIIAALPLTGSGLARQLLAPIFHALKRQNPDTSI